MGLVQKKKTLAEIGWGPKGRKTALRAKELN